MVKTRIAEKNLKPLNGFLPLFIIIAGFILSIAAFPFGIVQLDASQYAAGAILMVASLLGILVFSIAACGLKIVRPNEARVFTLFGKYYGTVKTPGFHYVNPFCASFNPVAEAARVAVAEEAVKQSGTHVSWGIRPKAISLKTQTLDNNRQKVNDILGNPIIIGAVVIWRVDNPTSAVFNVENYQEYLGIQTDSIIRNSARMYPYDTFTEGTPDADAKETTLRGSSLEIAATMQTELQQRVTDAGLVIEEVRITHLAYAEEIAAAMLQRQQAAAVIAARTKIVDGAVGMVKMAIEELEGSDTVVLDDERKAAMVSNLLVVLCGNREAQPVVNSGSIY